MTDIHNKLPAWMIAWLNSKSNKSIERDNPVLWRHILMACQQLAQLVVLFHDLYKTLAGVRPVTNGCCKNAIEPAEDVRRLLGVGAHRKHELKNACITTKQDDPACFLADLIGRLELARTVDDETVNALRQRIDIELDLLYVFHEVLGVLQGLQQVLPQGLITDSWIFPVRKLLERSKLADVFEEALILISAVEKVCKADNDGMDIYQRAAEKAGFTQAPFSKLGMSGDNLFRDIIPALNLGYIAFLVDRDREFMDDAGVWRKMLRSDALFEPMFGAADLVACDGSIKLDDLDLSALWRSKFGDDSLPLPESVSPIRSVELKNWFVRHTDECGPAVESRLGELTVERAMTLGVSFADLLVPLFPDAGSFHSVRFRDIPLDYLASIHSKFLPQGEYLPKRLVRFINERGDWEEGVVGEFTVERAHRLNLSYGDLFINGYDWKGQPVQARLADWELPVLRSYANYPTPPISCE
jgi:FMN phosphatase YigB (HAD superfamily)